MTPREPDRFSVHACAVVQTWNAGASGLSDLIAAALRREHGAVLDEVAQAFDSLARAGVDLMSEEAALQVRSMKSPAAAPAAGMVTCSTDTDEHHGAHRLRVPTRGEKSWCLDPVPVAAAPAAECADHWHCDPAHAAHACKANRSAPCPTCRAPPSEPAAPALSGNLVGSNARMAILGAESLAARLTEWAGALRNCLTTAVPAPDLREAATALLRKVDEMLAVDDDEPEPGSPAHELLPAISALRAALASKPGAGEGT